MAVGPSPSHHNLYKNGAECNQSKVSVTLSPVSESPVTSPVISPVTSPVTEVSSIGGTV